MVRRPNRTEVLSGSRRVLPTRRTTSQANNTQASSTASSVSAVGRRKASNHSSSVSMRCGAGLMALMLLAMEAAISLLVLVMGLAIAVSFCR